MSAELETLDELRDLCALERGLTAWEVKFVDSVAKQVKAGRSLSDAQTFKIHELWDKKVPPGVRIGTNIKLGTPDGR